MAATPDRHSPISGRQQCVHRGNPKQGLSLNSTIVHNNYQPAGVARFGKSSGGHLIDDPSAGRVTTLSFLDTWICEFGAIEQGAILQNLGLMAAALELGGFPHFAAHPFIWPLSLGFRTEHVPLSRLLGLPPNPNDLRWEMRGNRCLSPIFTELFGFPD